MIKSIIYPYKHVAPMELKHFYLDANAPYAGLVTFFFQEKKVTKHFQIPIFFSWSRKLIFKKTLFYKRYHVTALPMNNFNDYFIKFVKHHLPFNNKGILIPLYFLVSCIGVALLLDVLNIDMSTTLNDDEETFFVMGIICFVTGLWIFLTKNDYYKDREGNKVKVDINNSFFFIKMKYWAYIFFMGGLVCLLKAFVFKVI